jgi:large subunit ribosomal protein L6
MSRKGKLPIPLPKGVEVKVSKDNVAVKGPKGTLQQKLVPGVTVDVKPDHIEVSVPETDRKMSKFHGLYRTLIFNMINGITQGFEERLEMIGVGYRAAVQGNLLDVSVGFSHPTKVEIPAGIQVKVEKNTLIIINGIDKQAVGQFAAQVRAMRPPEPYQGKGIRYVGEYVRRKAGKAAKTAAK